MSVEYLHNTQYVGCIALSAHDRSTSLRKWALLKMWVCDYAASQKVVYITTAPPLNRAEKMVNKSIPAPDMHTCAKNTLGKNIGKYWGVKRNSGKTPLKPTKLGTAPL